MDADLSPLPAAAVQDPGSATAGHRDRLRARLLGSGGDALADHELVEYLLTLAMRRGDTKPLARRLLAEFGGIGPLLAADPGSLRRVAGMGDTGAAAIRIVQAAMTRVLEKPLLDAPMLASWNALVDYLRADMANLAIERVRVLHLDARNRLKRNEAISEGSVAEAAVHVREVIRRALELQSVAIILVHNHPSGDPDPSRADIDLTRQIVQAGKPLGIAVHDHVIVGRAHVYSMRGAGLI